MIRPVEHSCSNEFISISGRQNFDQERDASPSQSRFPSHSTYIQVLLAHQGTSYRFQEQQRNFNSFSKRPQGLSFVSRLAHLLSAWYESLIDLVRFLRRPRRKRSLGLSSFTL